MLKIFPDFSDSLTLRETPFLARNFWEMRKKAQTFEPVVIQQVPPGLREAATCRAMTHMCHGFSGFFCLESKQIMANSSRDLAKFE